MDPGLRRGDERYLKPDHSPFDPRGRFVYASNPGHDSVGVFSVDASTGVLSPVSWEPTRGATPRFIGLDPSGVRLFAANQRGDSIVEFECNQATGALAPTGQTVATGTRVCVVLR
jgi:6-phosphogluconolactonase